MSMKDFVGLSKERAAEDRTKWAVVIPPPFTQTGVTEIVGRFRTKAEAEMFRSVAPIANTLALRIEDLNL